jgi:hypothetical protein
MRVDETAGPGEMSTSQRPASGQRAVFAMVRSGMGVGVRSLVSAALGAVLMVALIALGLLVMPSVGVAAAVVDGPPRRTPIIPPSVPEGAREDWAVWSYVYKINEAWGKDWSLVIQWFEELDARYPGNPMVLDKLYVAYMEDGNRRREAGDLAGARMRYDQAAHFDPDRGVAQALLDELDEQEDAGR